MLTENKVRKLRDKLIQELQDLRIEGVGDVITEDRLEYCIKKINEVLEV
jgi:hypothetical protein